MSEEASVGRNSGDLRSPGWDEPERDETAQGSPEPAAAARPRVLHVVPADLARGAQVYAQALRERLDGRCGTHRLAVLFSDPAAVLRADFASPVASGRLRGFGYDPRALVGLRRTVRRFAPDLILAHGGEVQKYAALARRGRPALVYYSIGTVSDAARRGPRHRLYRRLCREADLVVGVSEEVAEESSSLFGVPAEKLRVVYNGRDPDLYLPREGRAPGSDEGTLTVGFLGHLTAGKRPEVFVEVVARLREEGQPLRAVMAGEGPMSAALEPLARGAGVELLGARHDAARFLQGCDVLVFTSAPEGEGMPGVLIEAGLAGVPVVATDVPGVTTVVDHGRTGFVVPAADVSALAGACRELLCDAGLRRQMGAEAMARCRERFSLEAGARQWERLIGEVIASHRAGRKDQVGAQRAR